MTTQASLFGDITCKTHQPAGMALELVADVWVDAEGASYSAFTYSIPAELTVTKGVAVAVPFGRQEGLTGFVVSVRPPEVTDPPRLRPIQALLSDEPIISLIHWAVLAELARYTVTPLGTVLQAALPPKLLGSGKSVVMLNTDKLASIPLGGFDPISRQLLETLQQSDALLTSVALIKRAGVPATEGRARLTALQRQGLIATQLDWQRASQGRLVTAYTATETTEALTARQQAVWQAVQAHNTATEQPVAKAALQQHTGVSDSVLKTLVTKGALATHSVPASQLVPSASAAQPLPHLTAAQQAVVSAIQSASAPAGQPWLIHGVTGSGKTAVYLHLADSVLKQGKQVLLLVPEIALTTQLAQRVRAVLPQTVVWHSNIPEGERIQLWQRLRAGEPLMILGARSGVLLPLDNLGLIIMDEAHDGSFKQETPAPRYHAEHVARTWATQTGAPLVLGSATPDIATLTESEAAGRVLSLPERYGSHGLAEVTCVDMRNAIQQARITSPKGIPPYEPPDMSPSKAEPPSTPSPSLLAPETLTALQETLLAGQQAIVLINRRGYHTIIQCQGCGQTHQCEDCDVALTYHRPQRASSTATPAKFGADAYVLCHHCGFRASAPSYCPKCASRQLRLMGTGSQRVVESLEHALPGARIARLDRDVQQKRHAPEAILTAFANHQADILVGTQMIAKGLDIANVTLVVVLQADSALLLPDYRASERAFQLLTQVAGRAGRGEHAGRVLVQTWQPDHPVIQLASEQDYAGFVDYERPIREKLGFPPYAQLFRFVVSGENDETLPFSYATALAAQLKAAFESLPDLPVQVLGPAPCVLSRVQGWFRYHVLIKVHSQDQAIRDNAHRVLSEIAQGLKTRTGLRVLLDVDAMSLL